MKQTAQHLQSSSADHLGKIFFRRVQELGDKTFVKLQRGERFEEVSWWDFGTRVRGAISGLYSLRLRKGERIGIIGQNSLEWLCTDMATLAGGLPNVVIAPTQSDIMLLKILCHSSCRAVFVGDEGTAGRLLNLKDQLPTLSTIIVMDGTGSGLPRRLTFAELISRGP
ncbi:MAG TPA: AMP-binding protein, partial [Candidatus Binatia bacterium]|nr:AMP-binding protein [Candidatus Binatia bacterium]